ncbi:rRNA biogenesis protein rrp5 [Pseudocercospora fuligena]|uniref:rRNA biogenesis protein RRP5 n=1 Tax=Pseudocercospora fuligena TaxID=685502 RepID=A0A8H6RQF0_9PEZI|nr:rRNA biogenesis protein rrp5 [Pseudocercospora fuligena]
MSAVKRKAVTDERPSKKAKSTEGKDEQSKEKKPRKSIDSGEKRALKSILQTEERSFPRGGAGPLTALENKQIQAQAERDAKQELETGQQQSLDDEDLFDAAVDDSRSKKKRKSDGVKDAKKGKSEAATRIQGLTYKNLAVGSTALGRITSITDRDIALALPNNLTGYAKISSISPKVNSKLEQMMLADEEDDEEQGDVDLKELLHVGQWLRAVVTATATDPEDGKDKEQGKSKPKKHIELSIEPAATNGGLSADSVVMDSTLQASVRSVEDHGLVMDVGLAEEGASGFISKKDLGAAWKLSKVKEGQVMLCLVTGKAGSDDRKVLKLSPDFNKLNGIQSKAPVVSDAPTVNAFLPGTLVDVLVTESGPRGIAGKIMGMLDVTADTVHSNAVGVEDMSKKYKIGSKVKARITYALPQADESRKVGVSLLDHVLALTPASTKLPENATSRLKSQAQDLAQSLPLSSIIDEAKVAEVLSDRGVFLVVSRKEGREERTTRLFAHISQLSDKRIDTLSSASGPYKPDTVHKARVLAYNPIDDIYYVSLKPSVLSQPFLRLDDLAVGQAVKGSVEKLIYGGKTGVTGILVKLSDNVNGLVPEVHFSDTRLQRPELKFKEGAEVKARVLSIDSEKRQIRLTLKKSLLEGESDKIWKDYNELEPGMTSRGTIVNLLDTGAAVQFYGDVRAWLPVAEMSESFIENPKQHLHLGQTVQVRIVSVSPEAGEMKVSCKDGSGDFTSEQQEAWEKLSPGHLVDGTVIEKTADSVILELNQGLRANVRVGHLVDNSEAKAQSAMKRIRIGEKLKNLLILDKQERSRTVVLSNKPSMVKDAAKPGKLIKSFSDARPGDKFHGFVRNITPDSVYAEFANGVVGLITKSLLLPEMSSQPSFGLRKDQTLTVWVSDVDLARQRFLLTMREPGQQAQTETLQKRNATESDSDVKNAVDPAISSMADFELGSVVKARIASVKATQINVRLADNVQGRVDVSEVFDSWDEITNKAAPLQNDKLKQNDTLDVKILGIHDARSHRFLPISHRQGKVPVFELSAKPSRVRDGDDSLLAMDSVKQGASYLAFVNNHSDNCVWANLSPNVRGRVSLMDLSDDVGQLQNVENRFRVGCALQVKVKSVDASSNKLDLTTKETLTLKELSVGMVVPARVTRISEHGITVVVAENIVCHVPLVELSDDYDQANPGQHSKNDIVRVCVVGLDLPGKRVYVSLRPSKVLSSSLPVKDAHIAEASQLKPGAIVRGFVKRVPEKGGIFVSLGSRVDALVRISDLSDQFVKDWRSIYEVDQLVQGRVVTVDASSGQVQLSLKRSHVDHDYQPPMTIHDLKQGMTVTGKVRKVEDFGAFVDIDNTQPRLSGLCHRSEVAARRIEDVRKHYSSGDVVKAKVLSVDPDSRKISLGLKASYFSNEAEISEDESGDESENVDMEGGVDVEDESDADGGVEVDLSELQEADSDADEAVDVMDVDANIESTVKGGLKTAGFQWGEPDVGGDMAADESEPETTSLKKRKRKPEIKEDRTGDLDKFGPRSDSDFERHLLSQPNNSGLWMQYMAFQLELSEVQKARDIAERALRMIHIRETEEKMHIWVAWLNMEIAYGDDERVEEVFKRACEVQDPLEMHERLANIYISAGSLDKADAVFEKIVANKNFRASPDVWYNYATFLMNNLGAADRARELQSRALKSISPKESRKLVAKFAALEFHSENGNAERGRTVFEGILSDSPLWSSGWDQWVDLERSRVGRVGNDAEAKKEAIDKTRALYERISQQKMKKRRAKFVFKKWLEFEEKEGKEKDVERVKALASEYVAKLAAKGEDEDE